MEGFSAGTVKAIGVLEVLATVVPVLVPVAATGVVLLMAGAGITHARRREWRMLPVNGAIGGLALLVAVLRFGPYAF